MTGEATPAEQVLARVEALRELGRPAEALALAQQGLASEPEHAGLLCISSVLANQLGDHGAAVNFAQAAVQAAPGWSWPLSLLAWARRSCGDIAGGRQAARDALLLNPEDETAHFEWGIGAAIQAENVVRWQRGPLLKQARESANMLEKLSPQDADGAALHAMVSLLQGRWAQHDLEVARALALEPTHNLASNTRLAGLQARLRPEVLCELYEQLRVSPEDAYARESLREQFSLKGWLRLTWGRWPWLLPVLVITRLVGLVLLSLPLYFVWRANRIRQNAEIYRAVFPPRERQRQRMAHLVLSVPLLLFGVLLAANGLFPRLFTNSTAIYGPVWLLLGVLIVVFTLPAAVTGRGGFFGRSPDDPSPLRLPTPRRLNFRRVVWPTLMTLLTVLLLTGLLIGGFFTLTDSQQDWKGALAGLAMLLLLTVIVGLLAAVSWHRARYGEGIPMRVSAFDGMLAGLSLLCIIVLASEVLEALGMH